MKTRNVFICLLLSVLAVFAAETEKFSLTVGAVKVIDLPFALESYRLSSKDKVTVEEINKQQLRVIGVKLGECNLTVTGAGVSIDYSISVKGNINNVLKRLRTDLETLPELDISVNQDYIVIKGTVSNPTNWNLLKKVLPLYGDTVHSFAVFRPTPETMLNLKKMLVEQGGFEFVQDGQQPQLGQLDMKITPDAVVISGELCSQDSIAKIKQILSTQTWLDLSDNNPSPDSGKIRGIVNLSVVQTLLDVEIVYVAVNESDADSFGAGAPDFSLNIRYLYDAVMGKAATNNLTFGAGMAPTLKFLASNGITRTYSAGHITFANHDEKGGSLHTGGTVSIKVSGSDNGSLQDINYGLTMKVKGGLISPNRVKLDLDLSNTGAVNAGGDMFDRSTDSTQQVVYCDLDKTLVLAGSKKISQGISNSGLPGLRNTPVLKWFVSTDAGSKNDTRLVILVCPRIAGQSTDVEIEVPLEAESKDVYKTGTGDLKEKKEKEDAAKPWYKRWFGK